MKSKGTKRGQRGHRRHDLQRSDEGNNYFTAPADIVQNRVLGNANEILRIASVKGNQMGSIPVFEESHIESLSKVLGECGSGTDISRFLDMCGIEDTSGESTKWRRLNTTFVNLQRKHRCANHIVDFISKFFSPVRFVGRNEQFEALRSDLNLVLAFAGLEYGADGKFRNRLQCQRSLRQKQGLRRFEPSFKAGLSTSKCSSIAR